MIGAILGDIIGSPYEYDMGDKIKDFPLFTEHSRFTDDTVLTVAIAEAALVGGTRNMFRKFVKKWTDKYPYEDYGARFFDWLQSEDMTPYNSYGNGSAMRVSSIAWVCPTLKKTREMARNSAMITHNHNEGIKGAEAVASAIFLARHERTKDEIKNYIVNEFGYDLSRTCDEIRPTYHHIETCQQTVPEAIIAFLEGKDFEDCIRTAVSLGGDCDTLAAITGSIAEAYYGIPKWLQKECKKRIPKEMWAVVSCIGAKKLGEMTMGERDEYFRSFNNGCSSLLLDKETMYDIRKTQIKDTIKILQNITEIVRNIGINEDRSKRFSKDMEDIAKQLQTAENYLWDEYLEYNERNKN